MVTPLKRRYLSDYLQPDLQEKMVFLGGPRQVGKTTVGFSLLRSGGPDHPGYLNWDNAADRGTLTRGELPGGQRLIVLDEIHKYARWRNLVKGFYDSHADKTAFLATGSARLDFYRKGGDSLQGRYHYHRLHPFSLMEISQTPTHDDLQQLMRFGGFPEPLLKANARHWRRWQRERLSRVVYEDLRDLEQVREVSLVEVLANALPDRVGSPLSVNSLREDLQVAFETVERWITMLENLYVCFRIMPYGSPKIRAVKKEKKLYLWDWSQVPDPGPRFENLVASQLLKYCHHTEDTQGHEMELRFLRDTDKREVDFVVLKDRLPLFAVECKTGDKKLNPALRYFKDRTPIPSFYQVHTGDRDFVKDGCRVLPLTTFCQEMAMP